jgi:hypothetical protein
MCSADLLPQGLTNNVCILSLQLQPTAKGQTYMYFMYHTFIKEKYQLRLRLYLLKRALNPLTMISL